MKNRIIGICLVFVCVFSLQAQQTESHLPFIEITATSDMEVVPDEIYIQITLLERMNGKEKITIDKQEAELKKNIKELGIEANNLSLNSANADYGKVRKGEKDVLVSKSYTLKISGTDMLAKLYERLDKMNAHDAFIARYTHSKILDLQKENRIKAMKAAKEKVDYLLAALSKQSGQVLEVRELDNYVDQGPIMMRAANLRTMQMSANTMVSDDSGAEMEFKKIKIKASFLVKYEILNK